MVQVELRININGNVDSEQLRRAMTIFGELVLNKIKDNIRAMDLITKSGEGGGFLQGWLSKWTGSELIIENTQDYATYLEYGTYGYWSQYGEDSFPETPHPKKRDLTNELKKAFPSGMQPFAPIRRVLYNDTIVEDLLQQSFEASI